MKRLILGISGGISFLLFLILAVLTGHLGKAQETQNAAYRWNKEGGAAQVSCFFSVNSMISEDGIQEFEHSIDQALIEAAVETESENPSARAWIDAYSADGQISVSSDRATVEADAIGIGGDFFYFHPLKLLSGAYFSGNDLMQDYCIIDQDAAWKLFGSNDVAGMHVYINGIPHIITGVVERETDKMHRAAGLDNTMIYVSYQTLSTLGSCNGINHYEIVMPNPITGFAYNFVKEKLALNERETEVVENSNRYSLMSRLKMIPKMSYRSMNGKAIIYPYWENVARCYEDILTIITIFEVLFLGYFVLAVVILFIYWWRHKGWTIKGVSLKLKDKAERLAERARAKRLSGYKKSKGGEL
ncbi:MAG: ABC transporter permease [Acetatifactor sp.]